MTTSRGFKGIWIPAQIWLSKDLTVMEKLFLVEIDSLDNDDGCFASNEYFANFFSLSKSRCSEIIKSLEKKEYLEIEYTFDEKKVKKRIIRLKGIRKIEGGSSEFRRGVFEKPKGVFEKPKDNNTYNNININNINKKKKKTELDVLIEAYTTNLELQEAILDFLKMRKGIKSPLTERALKSILKKLDNLASTDEDKILILEASIENCWKSVYPRNGYSKQSVVSVKQDSQDLNQMKQVSQDDLDELRKLEESLGDEDEC